jgi:hypothetical protein
VPRPAMLSGKHHETYKSTVVKHTAVSQIAVSSYSATCGFAVARTMEALIDASCLRSGLPPSSARCRLTPLGTYL